MGTKVKIRKRLGNFSLDVSLESNMDRIGILGASGAGKSMTLRCIAGIEEPDEGLIEAGGRVLYDSGRKICLKPQIRKVGYLFQNYALFPTMTVLENVAAGIREGRKNEKREKALAMLERFRIAQLRDRLPGEISGGQQQRTALARIMASEPCMILLDEPFSALDGYLRDQMLMEVMEMLRDFQGPVILVSHNRDEIYRFSEDLLVLEKGRSLICGKPAEIFREPVYKEAAKLTGCSNFCRIRKLGDHRFFAEDWGIEVETEGIVPDDSDCIGYRAHDFVPVWKKRQKNCIPVQLHSASELPFEYNCYFRPEGSGTDPLICWFARRDQAVEFPEKGIPDFLRVCEERILYLKTR